MESEGGEDLSYFWRGWYMSNWTLDLAVQGVSYVDGDASKGAIVKIQTRDRLVLPATVQIEFDDGTRRRLRLPAEAFIQSAIGRLAVQSTRPIRRVTVDPDHVLPDKDRSNNDLRDR
jgi:hypothetical protein